jgi:hypothetical protein
MTQAAPVNTNDLRFTIYGFYAVTMTARAPASSVKSLV